MSEIIEKIAKIKELLSDKSDSNIVDLVKEELSKAIKKPEQYVRRVESQDFNEVADNLYILSKALNVPPTNLRYYETVYKDFVSKAITTGGSGLGAQWLPQELSPNIIRLIEENYQVANLFKKFDMATNPFVLPVNLEHLVAFYRPEDTSTALSDISVGQTITQQVVLTAKRFIGYIPISDEATEDLLAAALPAIKDAIAKSLARAVETALLNGDDSSSHMDSDVTSSNDARKAFKGLRKYAISGSLVKDLSTSSLSITSIRQMRVMLKKYGANPQDLVLITSPSGYIQLVNLPEVVTYEKFGPQFTAESGSLTAIDGIPIVVSPFMREDLNTSGVYASNSNYTAFILVNKNAFVLGNRGGVTVESNRNILYQREELVSSMRVAFAPLVTPSASYPTVVLGTGVPTTL